MRMVSLLGSNVDVSSYPSTEKQNWTRVASTHRKKSCNPLTLAVQTTVYETKEGKRGSMRGEFRRFCKILGISSAFWQESSEQLFQRCMRHIRQIRQRNLMKVQL